MICVLLIRYEDPTFGSPSRIVDNGEGKRGDWVRRGKGLFLIITQVFASRHSYSVSLRKNTLCRIITFNFCNIGNHNQLASAKLKARTPFGIPTNYPPYASSLGPMKGYVPPAPSQEQVSQSR